jgi:YaiO family outer membrane protein
MLRSIFFLFTAVLLIPRQAFTQTPSAYDCFQLAKEKAFNLKDFVSARKLCKEALQLDPQFDEAGILLARLYGWEKQYDSARTILDGILAKTPRQEEALLTRVDIAYWDKQYTEALQHCEQGLVYYPVSPAFLIRKAKIFYAGRNFTAAKKTADSILRQDADHAEARALANELKDNNSKNLLGIRYDYFYFDRQFSTPWQVASLEFTRNTKIGPLTARTSFSNRFGKNGWQWEAEGYPRLLRNVYAYVNIGFSGDQAVFPKFRSGLSIYANLPKAWELEAGLRYLQFDNHTWIYTGSVGKYIRKYWFNARVFLSPVNTTIAQSYFITGRYYYAKADDYISISLGQGISPDENRSIQLNASRQLTSYRLNGGIQHSFHRNRLLFNIGWSLDEYIPKTYGNQITAGAGYYRKF